MWSFSSALNGPLSLWARAVAIAWQCQVATLALLTTTLSGTSVSAQDRAPSALQAVAAMEQVVVEAIARAEKSVVAIARVRKAGESRLPTMPRDEAQPLELTPAGSDPTDPAFVPNEFGTGVVIDAKGLIVTNYHVLGDVKTADYYVWIARKPYLAKVKAADPWLDLAVLEIAAENLKPMPLGHARDLKKGQFVIALGNPYAIARDGQPSAAWGMISNLSRQAPSPQSGTRPSGTRETLHHWGTLIQTDARIDLGASGGALVNLKGEMIGLTTSLAALAGYEKPGGFAIPIDDDFRRALDTLKSGRLPDYGFLGVAPTFFTAVERQQGRFGARIEDVIPSTPAATAGLRATDVITHVDGTRVLDDIELIRRVSGLTADMPVTLSVERGKQKLKVKVILSKKRVEGPRLGFAEVPPQTWRGMRVEYATAVPQFREQSRDLDPAGCVGVLEVERDSAAWKAGLRAGDFLSHVGRTRVSTPRQFYQAVEKVAGDVPLKLTAVEPAQSTRTISP